MDGWMFGWSVSQARNTIKGGCCMPRYSKTFHTDPLYRLTPSQLQPAFHTTEIKYHIFHVFWEILYLNHVPKWITWVQSQQWSIWRGFTVLQSFIPYWPEEDGACLGSLGTFCSDHHDHKYRHVYYEYIYQSAPLYCGFLGSSV